MYVPARVLTETRATYVWCPFWGCNNRIRCLYPLLIEISFIIAALRNDYKALTAKIDENLKVLHSARLTKVTPLVPESAGKLYT